MMIFDMETHTVAVDKGGQARGTLTACYVKWQKNGGRHAGRWSGQEMNLEAYASDGLEAELRQWRALA